MPTKSKAHKIIKSVPLLNSKVHRKRIRKTIYQDFNNLVFDFFNKCRNKNIPVTGPLIQQNAAAAAMKLGIVNFTASTAGLKIQFAKWNFM